MNRILLATLLTALLAAPLALAQGPPPGHTDPVAYAQDYAKDQAAQAQADPVAYASSKDPAAEAEHTLWLACWTAYDQAGHVLDPACAPFFTAPVQVDPAVNATVEITEVLNATGATALANEVLDAINDTVADPASALAQVLRIGRAVVHFVRDLVDFVLDTLGLGALGIAGGLLGAAEGLLDLLTLPVQGGQLALDGLGAALSGTTSAVDAAVDATLDTMAATIGAILDGAQATADAAASGLGAIVSAVAAAAGGVADAASAVADAVGAAASAVTDAVDAAAGAVAAAAGAVAGAVADATTAVASGIADATQAAADAVQSGVRGLASEVSSWFGGGKPATGATSDALDQVPKTGTEADSLLERLLDGL